MLCLLWLTSVLATFAASASDNDPVRAFSQDVYVWQRDWNNQVLDALRTHGSAFRSIVALKAEVTWKNRQPNVTSIDLDYEVLKKSTSHPGLALRIGPFPGLLMASNSVAPNSLAEVANSILQESRKAGLNLSELQLDYDCASSKLEDYAQLVSFLRKRVSPVPLILTALPDWIGKPGFRDLIAAADGYVLQVHSIERPRSFDAPFTLCNPLEAERAVRAAATFGKPFRVALPTYGYELAFDSNGKYLGLSAEGSARSWPAGTRKKEVRADPLEMAALSDRLRKISPSVVQGIIWYRFPVPGDIFNWQWPTLSAIVDSRLPRKSVQAEAHRVEPGLVEISLVNSGELDISSRLAVQARWSEARLIAGDALHGFELAERKPSSAIFKSKADNFRLPAGQKKVVGWLRISGEREVKLEIVE